MSDISSEPGGRSVTVTIKYGKEFSAPWAVFRGLASEVREDMGTFFGTEANPNLTLHDLTINATAIAQGKKLVATVLGGTVVDSSTGAQEAQGDVFAAAEAASGSQSDEPTAPAEDPHAAIRSEIATADSTDKLKVIWAQNQAAFQDSALMDVWKARGKALSAGAAS